LPYPGKGVRVVTAVCFILGGLDMGSNCKLCLVLGEVGRVITALCPILGEEGRVVTALCPILGEKGRIVTVFGPVLEEGS
jgi:hypothetical protein